MVPLSCWRASDVVPLSCWRASDASGNSLSASFLSPYFSLLKNSNAALFAAARPPAL
jgi:hypothetical protein